MSARDKPAEKDFWFTTKTGKHVHVLKGETVKDATKAAIEGAKSHHQESFGSILKSWEDVAATNPEKINIHEGVVGMTRMLDTIRDKKDDEHGRKYMWPGYEYFEHLEEPDKKAFGDRIKAWAEKHNLLKDDKLLNRIYREGHKRWGDDLDKSKKEAAERSNKLISPDDLTKHLKVYQPSQIRKNGTQSFFLMPNGNLLSHPEQGWYDHAAMMEYASKKAGKAAGFGQTDADGFNETNGIVRVLTHKDSIGGNVYKGMNSSQRSTLKDLVRTIGIYDAENVRMQGLSDLANRALTASKPCTPCQMTALFARMARIREAFEALHAKEEREIVECTFGGKTYRGYWITKRGHHICIPEDANPAKFLYHYFDQFDKKEGKKKVKRDKFQGPKSDDDKGEYIDIDGEKVWKPEGRKLQHFKYHYRKWKRERDEEDERDNKKKKEEEDAKKKKEEEDEAAAKKKAEPKPKPKPEKKETKLQKEAREAHEKFEKIAKKHGLSMDNLIYYTRYSIKGYDWPDHKDAIIEARKVIGRDKTSPAQIRKLNAVEKYSEKLIKDKQIERVDKMEAILEKHWPAWQKAYKQDKNDYYNHVKDMLKYVDDDTDAPIKNPVRALEKAFGDKLNVGDLYELIERAQKAAEEEKTKAEADEASQIITALNLPKDMVDPEGYTLWKNKPLTWKNRIKKAQETAVEQHIKKRTDFQKYVNTLRPKSYPKDGGEQNFIKTLESYDPIKVATMIDHLRDLHNSDGTGHEARRLINKDPTMYEFLAQAYAHVDPKKVGVMLNDRAFIDKTDQLQRQRRLAIQDRDPVNVEKAKKQFKTNKNGHTPHITINSRIPQSHVDQIAEVYNAMPPRIQETIKHINLVYDRTRTEGAGFFSPYSRTGIPEYDVHIKGHANSVVVKYDEYTSPGVIRNIFAHEVGHAVWHTLSPEQQRRFNIIARSLKLPVSTYTYQYTTVSSTMGKRHKGTADIYQNETHSEMAASFFNLQFLGFYSTYGGKLATMMTEGNKKSMEAVRKAYETAIEDPTIQWGPHGSLTARLRQLRHTLALNAAASAGKLYVRTFLIDDTRNSNGWRVSWPSIKKYAKTFKNKPGIEYTVCDQKGCHLDHTTAPSYEESKHVQRKYKKSTITDIQLDHANHTAYAIHRIDSPKLAKKIVGGQIKYLSPSVWPDQEHTTHKLKVTQDAQGGYNGQWHIDTTKWRGLHEAWVDVPAYGDKARITEQCMGTTAGECRKQLTPPDMSLQARARRIKQTLQLIAAQTKAGKEIVAWFSTEDGVHIPITKGQTKEQAFDQFVGDQQKAQEKEQEQAQKGGPADKPTPKIFDPQTGFKNYADDEDDMSIYLNVLSPTSAGSFDFGNKEEMDKIKQLIDSEYNPHDVSPNDMDNDTFRIYQNAVYAAKRFSDPYGDGLPETEFTHNALADLATMQKLNDGSIPFVDRDPAIFTEDGTIDFASNRADLDKAYDVHSKAMIRTDGKYEKRQVYADDWKNAKNAYRGIKIAALERMLKSGTYNSTDEPDAVAFASQQYSAMSFGEVGIMLVVPKQEIPLQHPGDLKYADDDFTGAQKDVRIYDYVTYGEARIPADTKITKGTKLYFTNAGDRQREHLDALMKAAKDSGMFASVERVNLDN